MAAAFGGMSGGLPGDPGTAVYDAFDQAYTSGFVGGGGTGSDTEPAAWLNMIMFSGSMGVDPTTLPMAAIKVTSAANFARQTLTIGPIEIPAPGYIYIYVNNSSNSTNQVIFDDLEVTHLHAPFVAGGDYYPFGLPMADRQINVEPYRWGYQGQFAEEDAFSGHSMENCFRYLLKEMDSKEFKKIFGEMAKSNSFESAFGGWFRESAESVVVLDLQKSNFGNYYEMNVKIYVQGLFGHSYTRNKDLVKKDTGDVFRRQPPEYKDVLNFDSLMDDEKRKERLGKLFNEFIVPFTNRALSKSGIKELVDRGEIALLPAVKKELA